MRFERAFFQQIAVVCQCRSGGSAPIGSQQLATLDKHRDGLLRTCTDTYGQLRRQLALCRGLAP
ncbi:MAG: hypothetical protein E7050_00620 [Lentisphaerae bacterium]|nr:hypothetical protein [Lentisphaerota bacterium]